MNKKDLKNCTTQINLIDLDPKDFEETGDIPNAIFRVTGGENSWKVLHTGVYNCKENAFYSGGSKYELSQVDMWGIYDWSIMNK